MRLKKWKSFLCICTSCTLLMSTAASANPAAITPLEEVRYLPFSPGTRPLTRQRFRPRDRVRNPEVMEGSFHLTGHPHSEVRPHPEVRPQPEARLRQGVRLYPEVRRGIRQLARLPGGTAGVLYHLEKRQEQRPGLLTRQPRLPCRSRR